MFLTSFHQKFSANPLFFFVLRPQAVPFSRAPSLPVHRSWVHFLCTLQWLLLGFPTNTDLSALVEIIGKCILWKDSWVSLPPPCLQGMICDCLLESSSDPTICMFSLFNVWLHLLWVSLEKMMLGSQNFLEFGKVMRGRIGSLFLYGLRLP